MNFVCRGTKTRRRRLEKGVPQPTRRPGERCKYPHRGPRHRPGRKKSPIYFLTLTFTLNKLTEIELIDIDTV